MISLTLFQLVGQETRREAWNSMNRQQRPNLKNGVDLQLQSAFNDGNWAVVIRLAEKRAKTFNDQYYEVRLLRFFAVFTVD